MKMMGSDSPPAREAWGILAPPGSEPSANIGKIFETGKRRSPHG